MNADEPKTLREVALLASDRNDGARGRELGRKAEERGLKLTYTTVDKIIAGTYKSRPKRPTLEALAELSGLTREQVYRAAGEPLPMGSLADQLPEDADLLTPEQRTAVLSVVRQFASLNRELASDERKRVGEGRERPPSMNGAEPECSAEDVDVEEVTPPSSAAEPDRARRADHTA